LGKHTRRRLLSAVSLLRQRQQARPENLERVEVAGKKGDLSAWVRAESQRFVVYSDAREEDVTQLLDNLEKLDHVLRLYTQPLRKAEQRGPKLTL
jgi:hypothetical protein